MIIGDILKKIQERYDKYGPLVFEVESKEYKKRWNNAVKCFQTRLNADRKRANLKELPFIAVRQKMVALQEIDDLKWCWKVCAKYATTRDTLGNRNTFSKCWFGMFDTKKK